jgi:hypothetical protein
LHKIIPTIQEVLAAGELAVPKPHEEAVALAIPNKEGGGLAKLDKPLSGKSATRNALRWA